MKELGINYEHATPQTISDSWWFWNYTNIPSELPEWISELKVKPMDAIGHGLSEKKAIELSESVYYLESTLELLENSLCEVKITQEEIDSIKDEYYNKGLTEGHSIGYEIGKNSLSDINNMSVKSILDYLKSRVDSDDE